MLVVFRRFRLAESTPPRRDAQPFGEHVHSVFTDVVGMEIRRNSAFLVRCWRPPWDGRHLTRGRDDARWWRCRPDRGSRRSRTSTGRGAQGLPPCRFSPPTTAMSRTRPGDGERRHCLFGDVPGVDLFFCTMGASLWSSWGATTPTASRRSRQPATASKSASRFRKGHDG